jgi:hypothetical protein
VQFHRSLGIVLWRFFDSDSFFQNEVESDEEQGVASVPIRDAAASGAACVISRRGAFSRSRQTRGGERDGCVLVSRQVPPSKKTDAAEARWRQGRVMTGDRERVRDRKSPRAILTSS